jgi:DNA polymerase sigma
MNNLCYKLNEHARSLENSRCGVYERLKRIIRQSFNGLEVGVMSYGSWNTGLLIPSSDIDLCITGFAGIDRQGVIKILETIENNLRLFKWVLDIKPIYTATIPVLKIVSQIFRKSNPK